MAQIHWHKILLPVIHLTLLVIFVSDLGRSFCHSWFMTVPSVTLIRHLTIMVSSSIPRSVPRYRASAAPYISISNPSRPSA